MSVTPAGREEGEIQAILLDSGLEDDADLRRSLEELRMLAQDPAPRPRADLAELLASAGRDAGENEADALRLGDLFLRLRRLPKPAIAVVHGNALAGGCGLATACDLVVAAESARFGYPEIQRGFVPAMVLAMLRRLVGEAVAFDLVSTGRILSAREAAALGMVARVAPDTELDQVTEALVRPLATGSATALALTKQLLYELDGRSFSESIRLGARVNAIARTTPDFRERIERFLSG